jgi:hypothetical protein
MPLIPANSPHPAVPKHDLAAALADPDLHISGRPRDVVDEISELKQAALLDHGHLPDPPRTLLTRHLIPRSSDRTPARPEIANLPSAWCMMGFRPRGGGKEELLR